MENKESFLVGWTGEEGFFLVGGTGEEGGMNDGAEEGKGTLEDIFLVVGPRALSFV